MPVTSTRGFPESPASLDEFWWAIFTSLRSAKSIDLALSRQPAMVSLSSNEQKGSAGEVLEETVNTQAAWMARAAYIISRTSRPKHGMRRRL